MRKNLVLVFAALLLMLGCVGKSEAATESYAPAYIWAVDSWYSMQETAHLSHKRGFPDPDTSYRVDWVWHGTIRNTAELPCSWSPDRYWSIEYIDWYFNAGRGGAVANANYRWIRCSNMEVWGTDDNYSSSMRHWICADGVWREPWTGTEVCYVPEEQPENNKNKGPCPAEQCFGDPVNAGTGNKFEVHTEYRSSGRSPLEFSWTYNSTGPFLTSLGDVVGQLRSTNFSRQVSVSTAGALSTAYVTRPDGSASRFNKTGSSWTASAGSKDELVESAGPGFAWIYTDDSGNRDFFDSLGKLVAIENSAGDRIVVGYDSSGRIDFAQDDSGRKLRFNYDVANRVASLSLPEGGSIAFAYTATGYLEKVTYPGNSTIKYLYDETGFVANAGNGALTGVVDENNSRYSSTTYDAKGRATSTKLANGIDTESATYADGSHSYNTQYAASATITTANGATRQVGFVVKKGRVVPSSVSTTCTGCASSSVSYSYDNNGYVDTVTRNGIVEDSDFNARGLLTQRIEAANDATGKKRTTQTDWHASLRKPVEQRTYDAASALVAKQTWSYNARGQVLTTSSVDPVTGVARTTAITYCEQANVDAGTCPLLGLVTTINGPRTDVNDVTTYTYYPSDDATCASAPTTCPHRKGDLWMVQDAAGNITETLKYDGAGRVLSVKDANGVLTDFEYHPRGWLTARKVRGTDNASEADDQITRIDYTPTGLVQKTTLPDGSFTSYTYDAAHRLTDITDGEGNKIHYTLDNAGNRTKEDTLGTTGSVLRTLSRLYNQLGQLQTHKDAYNHATGYVYDANGNTDTVTDALSRVTDNDYDPLNRLTKTIQNVGGLNVTTQFKYDAQDNLTEVVDPKNLSTKYTYNGLGDLKQLESPDTGITSYTYDSAGNRQTQTDARGVTATYGYDALNRLASIAYPDTSLNVGYSYDTAATACPAGETFAAGRLSRITDGSGSTQYCYDRFGQMVRKVQTTAGQSLTVRYGYTKAGQLSSVTYPDGTVADYVRDALGRTTEIGVTRPGGSREILLTSASYYPFGPASEWVFGNGRLFQRTLNQNYQPGVVQDQSASGLSLGYEFDAVGNLVKLRNGNQSEPPLRRYVYDALNRLTETRDGTTDALLQGYGYDATGNRVSATDGGATTAYTLAANSHRLMNVGSVARTYDSAGNTTSIGGAVREFVYSDASRMSAVKQGGVTAMNYAYNGKGEQVRRVNGADDTLNVYDEAGHWLGEYDAAGVPRQQVVWLDDLPVGLIVGPVGEAAQAMYYIEADALGTPRVVVDAQRDVAVWVWPLVSEAFGNDQPTEDADGDGTSLAFNLRFPGQRYDAATGLNYNYFRDYDTGSGRYVESDLIGLDGGISTYMYAGSQPFVSVDLDGLAACIYVISRQVLSCAPNSGGKPLMLGPGGVWSGQGGCKNDAGDKCLSNTNDGPILPGSYMMNRDKRPKHQLFWRLEPNPKKPGWLCRIGAERCGFMLHPGSVSWGCITADKKSAETMDDYKKIHQLLLKEEGSNRLQVMP